VKQIELFLPHDAMLAWCMLSPCVHPSVSQSVTRRYCAKMAKLWSCKQRHTTAKELLFSVAKDLGEIPKGSLQHGPQMPVGWVQIGDFRLIYCYISETVQDKDIVTMER